MKPEVSIIIPTHNNGETIERAIRSVENQTFSGSKEIVVVNDACDDDTDAVIERLQKEFDNIVYAHVENHCAGKTRIDGIHLSKGEYLFFLDGDDEFHPEMIEKMIGALKKEDADIANCSLYYVTEKGPRESLIRGRGVYDRYGGLKAFFRDYSFRGFMHTKAFRGDLLRSLNVEYPKEQFLYEDTLYLFFAILSAGKVVSIPDRLIYYYKTNPNAVTSKTHNRVQDNINVRAVMRKRLEELGDPKFLKAFRNQKLRIRLLLLADKKMSRFGSKEEKREALKDLSRDLSDIYGRKPLIEEGRSYSRFLSLIHWE